MRFQDRQQQYGTFPADAVIAMAIRDAIARMAPNSTFRIDTHLPCRTDRAGPKPEAAGWAR
ncbi:MAG: hypothetical protein ACHQ0J_12830, partial [Candidatus Dormibacterales bacterium]